MKKIIYKRGVRNPAKTEINSLPELRSGSTTLTTKLEPNLSNPKRSSFLKKFKKSESKTRRTETPLSIFCFLRFIQKYKIQNEPQEP